MFMRLNTSMNILNKILYFDHVEPRRRELAVCSSQTIPAAPVSPLPATTLTIACLETEKVSS